MEPVRGRVEALIQQATLELDKSSIKKHIEKGGPRSDVSRLGPRVWDVDDKGVPPPSMCLRLGWVRGT
jgi:hypothetical protein